jgi:hypothetical protein
MLGEWGMSSPDFTAQAVRELSDISLLAAQLAVAGERRVVDAHAAILAAEIGRRSRHELGQLGLAQRMGARTPERLVQQLTGSSARDASTMVRVGSAPASSLLARAVADGVLGLDAADAISAGLGESAPDEVVVQFIEAAATITVEKLGAQAREARADLDEEGVLDREQHLRSQRYLRLSRVGDGMTRLSGLLDPESAAIVVAAYDGATSPRRGGPRFVDVNTRAAVEDLIHDERTTEQIAVDAFVELIRLGGDADSDVLPAGRPSVRVLVTAKDLERGSGRAQIEGQSAPIGLATVERLICDSGVIPIRFESNGQAIDVGRDQRLFTTRQRIALAARDGGCRFPGCERPPSWCEAHHIVPWSHGGRTDLVNGILMCRHHHLLIHDQGWQIERRESEYRLIPPRSVDPGRRPMPAPANSPLVGRLLAG